MLIHPSCVPSLGRTLCGEHELFQRVTVRLQSRLGDRVEEFQMSWHEEGLILRGQVRSYYGKQMAQEVVMEVSGLSILSNDIEVRRLAVTRCGTVAAKYVVRDFNRSATVH
jgi:osmotically-inducible protein OsmY